MAQNKPLPTVITGLCLSLGLVSLNLFSTGLFFAPAHAAFPERPVRMIVASAAGGGTDIIARLLARKLSDDWSQTVVVDNRPGGGGVIATDLLAKAPADGHTLLLQSVGISYAPALYRKLPFDPQRDVTPVTIVGAQPFILAIHPSVAARSVRDLIALARSKPGELRYASGGVSGASHLGTELFRVTAGINIAHVPYKGTGPGMNSVISGETQLIIAGVGTVMPHARSGRVRALAVTGSRRSPAVPDLPTVAESALTGFAFDVWYGLFAPAATPKPVLGRLESGATGAFKDGETIRRFNATGIDVNGNSSADANRYLRSEMGKWAKVIREAGITAN
jgi:tripartite-type tricarboxylate transporter receptor subunit TctC